MFGFFKNLSLSRGAWVFLSFCAFALECTALYFQHGMGLQPCVMCIYERVAMLAILIAGLLGMLAPRFLLVRLVAIALWIFGALKGLEIARRHTGYQLDPKPWDQCPLVPEFPPTLPLDQWFPNIFAAGGSCKDITWQMLNWTMPQWLTLVFGTFLAFGIVVLLSQFKRTGRKASLRNRNLFH